MLQAKSMQGSLVTLVSRTSSEIEQFKQQKVPFFCPACKEPVIIKAGSKVIPHFAHRSLRDCPSDEGGEGAYHEQGKLLLYQWLYRQQLDVTLEAYIPAINQRPDLFLMLKGKQIAIEYQCARIPIKQINQRNEGYKKAGIIPIWILGANHFQRQTTNHIKMNQFLLHFIHQFSSRFPPILYFFCPHTKQFIMTQDLLLTKTGQAIGRVRANRLERIPFIAMFNGQSLLQREIYQLWKKEKRQFRLKQRKRLYGRELAWHQWLYVKNIHLEHLPSIIHLPVAAQYRIKTPPWDWQSRLSLEVIHHLALGEYFSIRSCRQLIRGHLYDPRDYPLITSTADPIEQYLQLLVDLKVIQQRSPGTYQKIKSLHFHKNVEEAVSGDVRMINQLLTGLKQNTSMFHR